MNNPQCILITMLGLLPQFWFRAGYVFAGGDIVPPQVYGFSFLQRLAYVWDTSQGLGQPGFQIINLLLVAYYSSLAAVGIPFWVSQRVFYSVMVALSTYAIYHLLEDILHNKYSATLGSFFYVINIVNVLNILNPLYLLGLAITPLFMSALSRSMRIMEGRTKYLIPLALISFSLSFLFNNPPFFATIVLFMASFVIFQLSICSKKSETARYLLKLFFILFALNLWWILPVFSTLFLSSTWTTAKTPLSLTSFTHARETILNVFRLNWVWSWNFKEYFSFDPGYYNSPLMIFVSVMPSALAFAAVLARNGKKQNYYVAYFSVMSIVTIFFQKTVNPPLPEVYIYLYEHFPFFWIFRDPNLGVPLLICYSVLIAIVSQKIFLVFSGHRLMYFVKICLLAGLVITESLITFPLYTGQVVPPSYTTGKTAFVKIPSYWDNVVKWLEKNSTDVRTLLLPPDPFYQVGYTWGYYGADFIPYIFKGRVIIPRPAPTPFGGGYFTTSGNANVTLAVYNAIKTQDVNEFSNIIHLLGINYILLRGDINYTTLLSQGFNTSLADMKAFLSKIPSIKSVKVFNNLTIYRVTNSSSIVFSTPGGIVKKFVQVNPTTYYVTVNSSGPFILGLRESYDPGWKLYLGRVDPISAFFQKPLTSFPILNYANGWYINRTGILSVTVYYETQSIFFIGIIASITTGLALSAALIVNEIKRARRHCSGHTLIERAKIEEMGWLVTRSSDPSLNAKLERLSYA